MKEKTFYSGDDFIRIVSNKDVFFINSNHGNLVIPKSFSNIRILQDLFDFVKAEIENNIT